MIPSQSTLHLRASELWRPFLSVGERAVTAILIWQERSAERQRLKGMEDYLLKDVGLTRAEMDHEVRKPFWQG